jgi:hypothetical protein
LQNARSSRFPSRSMPFPTCSIRVASSVWAFPTSFMLGRMRPTLGRMHPTVYVFGGGRRNCRVPSICPLLLDSMKGKKSPCLSLVDLLDMTQFSHVHSLIHQ